MPKEHKKKSWHNLGFSTPITESAYVDNNFIIRGVAISETTTHNGHKYIAEELERAAPSLVGRPLLVDHDNRVESIKGRVTSSIFEGLNRHIQFEAHVMDKNIQQMITDGRLNSVSIGAFAKDLVKEDDGSIVARGLQIVELSLVAVPADENANFAMALDKSYQLKESLDEEEEEEQEEDDIVTEEKVHIYTDERRLNEMVEKEEKVDDKYNSVLSENAKLLEKLSLLEGTNKVLMEEKRKNLIESYKKLCVLKKVREKDLANVSDESIKLLIEQLNDISISEDKTEFKAEISEKLPQEVTSFVISNEPGIDRGNAMWEMPNVDSWRKLHKSITRVKREWQ